MRIGLMKGERSFTLVELMIVVAIVMVLAAIAVPNFYMMQMRAKKAETTTNLDGLITAQDAYEAAQDDYVGFNCSEPVLSLCPDDPPGKTLRDWVPLTETELLGWAPDGQIRGGYLCQGGTEADCFGATDLDVDGQYAFYRVIHEADTLVMPLSFYACFPGFATPEPSCF